MEAQAIAKNVRMSARKMRLVIDQIRDMQVNDAYSVLQFSKKAAAVPIDPGKCDGLPQILSAAIRPILVETEPNGQYS